MEEAQQQIIKEFKGLNNWLDKYRYLIKLGKESLPIEDKYKTEETLIKGCQVKTWFHSSYEDGKVYYQIDSLSLIIKGTVALLLRVLNGRTPEEIKNTKLYFIDEIGLRENFSLIKANSLWKLTKLIEEAAIGYTGGEK